MLAEEARKATNLLFRWARTEDPGARADILCQVNELYSNIVCVEDPEEGLVVCYANRRNVPKAFSFNASLLLFVRPDGMAQVLKDRFQDRELVLSPVPYEKLVPPGPQGSERTRWEVLMGEAVV